MYMYNRWSIIYICFIYIEHFFYNLVLRYIWKRKGRYQNVCAAAQTPMYGGRSRFLSRRISETKQEQYRFSPCNTCYLLFRFVLRETHTNNDFHESEYFRTVDKLCVKFDVCNIELLTVETSFVGFAPNGINVKWQLARSHSVLLWKHTHCRVCLSLLWP